MNSDFDGSSDLYSFEFFPPKYFSFIILLPLDLGPSVGPCTELPRANAKIKECQLGHGPDNVSSNSPNSMYLKWAVLQALLEAGEGTSSSCHHR